MKLKSTDTTAQKNKTIKNLILILIVVCVAVFGLSIISNNNTTAPRPLGYIPPAVLTVTQDRGTSALHSNALEINIHNLYILFIDGSFHLVVHVFRNNGDEMRNIIDNTVIDKPINSQTFRPLSRHVLFERIVYQARLVNIDENGMPLMSINLSTLRELLSSPDINIRLDFYTLPDGTKLATNRPREFVKTVLEYNAR